MNFNLPTLPTENMDDYIPQSGSFLESLKIAYPINIPNGSVEAGDFYKGADEEAISFSNSIDVAPINYRYQILVTDVDSKEYVDNLLMLKGEPYFERKEFLNFCEKYDIPKSIDGLKKYNKDKSRKYNVSFGFDFLLYFPKADGFFTMFLSKKLAPSASKIQSCAKVSGFVTLKTNQVKYKKFSWYTLDVKPIDVGEITINIGQNDADEALKIFCFKGSVEEGEGRSR